MQVTWAPATEVTLQVLSIPQGHSHLWSPRLLSTCPHPPTLPDPADQHLGSTHQGPLWSQEVSFLSASILGAWTWPWNFTRLEGIGGASELSFAPASPPHSTPVVYIPRIMDRQTNRHPISMQCCPRKIWENQLPTLACSWGTGELAGVEAEAWWGGTGLSLTLQKASPSRESLKFCDIQQQTCMV